ncbi:MAG: 3-deoxy-D-manno-octulosonic acid transferase [Bacteroidales bacterium]|nr:3-deoxy-D-manno-octulosonic acid transferase [Bacteroidales bacterium]
MHSIYNFIAYLTDFLFGILAIFFRRSRIKFLRFVRGQRGLMKQIIASERATGDERPTLWIHASSLGEYNVAKPIVRKLHESGHWRIVLTVFSPSGLDYLKRYRQHIDAVYALPLDKPWNVRRFLDAVQPQRAVFIISEYWVNYLSELGKRKIPTYLISANITERAPFMHWYGSLWRRQLKTYSHFFVLNEASQKRLERLGFTNVTVTGDPLFDNARKVARSSYENAIIEHFVDGQKVFIAGSIHDRQDLEMVTTLANRHQDTRFILVPHEISPENILRIKKRLLCQAHRYSHCSVTTDFSKTQVLIIDFMGALASIYRFACWAYVGGGFTPYLHSIIEATAYGLPVAYGPNIERKPTAQELAELGVGRVVENAEQLDDWFSELKNNDKRLDKIRRTAKDYMHRHEGATETIVATISNNER